MTLSSILNIRCFGIFELPKHLIYELRLWPLVLVMHMDGLVAHMLPATTYREKDRGG
jgi:hypothetical protein